jgi:hypothetical protein
MLAIWEVTDRLLKVVFWLNSESLNWKCQLDFNELFIIIMIIIQLSFLFQFFHFNDLDWILDRWDLDADLRENKQFEI